MLRYDLNYKNVDEASEAIIAFLSNNNVDSKDVQRIRLSIEEVLLKYLDRFDESKYFTVVTSKRLRSLVIELSIVGESYDPFSENEDGEATMLHSLLSGIGLAPVWRYKNGKNIISFVAKKKKLSQILQLGIAILAAIALGGICYLLPQSVSNLITEDVITPVFNTFMGLLSAISDPIIFLSVVWGIVGIGDITTFGKIGKKMITRF